MFDRFVRYAQARRALHGGRLEEALRLTEDPLLAGQRKTDELRAAACLALVRRAERRVEAGDGPGAKADCQLVLGVRPDDSAAAAALARVERRVEADRAAQVAAVDALTAARRALADADLEGAERLLAREASAGREVAAMRRRLESCREAATAAAEEAKRALVEGRHAVALDAVASARAIDRRARGVEEVALRLAAELGPRLGKELVAQLAAGDPFEVAARFAREHAALPELAGHPAFARARRSIAEACRGRFERALVDRQLEVAVEAWRRIPPALAETECCTEVRETAGHLAAALAHRARGEYELAATEFEAAANGRFGGALANGLETARKEAAAIEKVRATVRRAVADGDLTAARAALDPALIRWPLCRSLQDALAGLDDSARERDRQLAQVRELTREGRLRQAHAQALLLVAPGPLGEETRRVQSEIQARLDQVSAGLDQIRRDVHGRASVSEDGVAHCLARLDELARIQVDHEELTRVRDAVAAELRGLRLLSVLRDAVEIAGPEMVDMVREVVAIRPLLLTIERLDARLLTLADLLLARGKKALAGGRTRPADRCVAALQVVEPILPSVPARVAELVTQRESALEHAVTAAAAGRRALAARDLSAAESSLDLALQHAEDAEDVRALAREVADLRSRVGDLQAIDELAGRQEYARAQERLASMPPTPSLLRTRIYDMKRNLARSQGLDGGFLLRVDEGGEFLVLRGDSISIGNLRDGSSDITVLANIAGHHARIQRRMTFHGGMEDRICADRGDIQVASGTVSEHRMRDGDEIRLGQHLQLCYRLPSNRSLSALLRLRGGFQASGTDKILLLKDRGRDGRILIGNAKDAHVPLGVATPEVELFASKDGQIRVRWAGNGGTIDGRPFSGEHPVIPGTVVTCGEVSFMLLPRP